MAADRQFDEIREDAVRVIREQQREIEKLTRRNVRLRELYESTLAVVRRYQNERDGLLDRVKGALLGIKQE